MLHVLLAVLCKCTSSTTKAHLMEPFTTLFCMDGYYRNGGVEYLWLLNLWTISGGQTDDGETQQTFLLM